MEWTQQRLSSVLRNTQCPLDTPTTPVEPLAFKFEQTGAALWLTFMDDAGRETAHIGVEIGSDGKTPVMRVWDGENGQDNDPILERRLDLSLQDE